VYCSHFIATGKYERISMLKVDDKEDTTYQYEDGFKSIQAETNITILCIQ
jgi:hypothetical protein